jgi:hypothetical protein
MVLSVLDAASSARSRSGSGVGSSVRVPRGGGGKQISSACSDFPAPGASPSTLVNGEAGEEEPARLSCSASVANPDEKRRACRRTGLIRNSETSEDIEGKI